MGGDAGDRGGALVFDHEAEAFVEGLGAGVGGGNVEGGALQAVMAAQVQQVVDQPLADALAGEALCHAKVGEVAGGGGGAAG